MSLDRDKSIDFAKGIAILSVIFLHVTPEYNNYVLSIVWIGQSVPLFLLITGYLTYSGFQKGMTVSVYYSKKSIMKMLHRIFIPFFITTLALCVLYYFFHDLSIKKVLRVGGIGPGSYYPWLYLQFWIVLPFIIKIIDTFSIRKSLSIFIIVSIILEYITCVINLDPETYRLLFYRYILVVALGCYIRKLNINNITVLILILAITSLGFSIVETYSNIDFKPFFIDLWKGYHWITAFYPMFLFILIRIIYRETEKGLFLKKFFEVLGKYSYEIFLCQMLIFSVTSIRQLKFIGNTYIETGLYICGTTIMSIAPILFYKLWLKKYIRPSSI